MRHNTRTTLISGVLLTLALALSLGCNETTTTEAASSSSNRVTRSSPARTLSSGTILNVTLGSTINSETASVGDSWQGTLTDNVETQNGDMIAAGSNVRGVVTAVVPAKRGSRAMLDLSVRGITAGGRDQALTANGESVIAGSTRARNLGAIAGGVAAGALIGKAVGDGKNGTVGGIIGGVAATGVVAGSKGYQVVLKPGTVMSFTVNQSVAMR